MLYSVGKDSAVMLHLARKAFYPAPPPFPLLHVDTTWKFKDDVRAAREERRATAGMELLVYQNPEAAERGINPFDHGPLHTDMWKTEGLKQALDKYGFDAAFGGARRDEEKSRAKERIFSFRTASHGWDPKNQRPELWNLYNARKNKGESIRVFPISQLDRARRVAIHPARGDRDRPALLRRPAPDVRARRAAADGRRTSGSNACSATGRDRRSALDPLPHAGLLPADRRGRERGRDAGRSGPGDAAHHHLRTAGPRDRQGRAAARAWRRRSRRGISDGRYVPGPVYETDALIAEDIDAYLDQHQHKTMLRFITCGSVDDGKSTLIGRLLYDSKMIFEDQLAALESDSKRVGTQGQEIDFALLVDGLAAEREQGITIDVAYRFFTPRSASSSSPTARGTSSTPATWSPARAPPTWR